MALSDGVFHRLERRLIDRITRYGDLLVYLRKATNGALALSWEKIDGLSAETKRELARRLPDILERTCNSFVHPLAVADGMVDSVDFLEKLESELQEIALSLSNIDGVRREAGALPTAEMLEHPAHPPLEADEGGQPCGGGGLSAEKASNRVENCPGAAAFPPVRKARKP